VTNAAGNYTTKFPLGCLFQLSVLLAIVILFGGHLVLVYLCNNVIV